MKKALFNKGAGLRSCPWAAGTHLLLGAASTSSMTNAMQPSKPARRTLMTFLVHTTWCTFSGLGVKLKERAPVLAVLWWPWMMCSPYQRCVVGPKWCVLHPITGLYMSTVGDRICACKRKHQACSACYPNCRFSSIAWDAANLQCLFRQVI